MNENAVGMWDVSLLRLGMAIGCAPKIVVDTSHGEEGSVDIKPVG